MITVQTAEQASPEERVSLVAPLEEFGDFDGEGGSLQKDDLIVLVPSISAGKYTVDTLREALLTCALECYKRKPGAPAIDSLRVELSGVSPAQFLDRVDQVARAVAPREPRATW